MRIRNALAIISDINCDAVLISSVFTAYFTQFMHSKVKELRLPRFLGLPKYYCHDKIKIVIKDSAQSNPIHKKCSQ